ncbi:MAG: hypothetical protein OEW68_01215 [Gammaproteobacteria bacterium]|nr:hypothetical protein [Gammaproteobacteria bacterium]MDH4313443.1 hypothetical protein [Gammaproteobacteria bacterium]MDH5213019.1 hypothetical protein [Gammaproteobacteria bacterium]MDH5500997.1 hypothetical protein [Gammaproteobacteria bacterium]
MKYLVSLVFGLVFGAALLFAGLYLNPFASKASVSPLAVSDDELVVLDFSMVPSESILFTNNGDSVRSPNPLKVQQLWEPAIEQTWVSVVELSSARGEPIGVGVKFSSTSEATRPLNAEALVDSIWHVYLPGRGTLFVEESENYWHFLRDIVIPARWSSSDSWRASWHGITTAGPGALRTARVVGQTGEFAGVRAEAVESISASAYSANEGPVAMSGSLLIAVPKSSDGKE